MLKLFVLFLLTPLLLYAEQDTVLVYKKGNPNPEIYGVLGKINVFKKDLTLESFMYGSVKAIYFDVEDGIDEAAVKSEILNYPNPFTSFTTIDIDINDLRKVDVQIFDQNGNLVRNLKASGNNDGKLKLVWDASNESGLKVNSGSYYCLIKSNNQVITKKIIFIK